MTMKKAGFAEAVYNRVGFSTRVTTNTLEKVFRSTACRKFWDAVRQYGYPNLTWQITCKSRQMGLVARIIILFLRRQLQRLIAFLERMLGFLQAGIVNFLAQILGPASAAARTRVDCFLPRMEESCRVRSCPVHHRFRHISSRCG